MSQTFGTGTQQFLETYFLDLSVRNKPCIQGAKKLVNSPVVTRSSKSVVMQVNHCTKNEFEKLGLKFGSGSKYAGLFYYILQIISIKIHSRVLFLEKCYLISLSTRTMWLILVHKLQRRSTRQISKTNITPCKFEMKRKDYLYREKMKRN